MTSTGRFLIRFAIHLPPVYRTNFLAELIEDYPARFRELPDGAFEIVSQKVAKTDQILGALKQEENRGGIVIEELTGDDWLCCFCGLAIHERTVEVAIAHDDAGVQGLRAHLDCLKERLHPSVPFLDVDD